MWALTCHESTIGITDIGIARLSDLCAPPDFTRSGELGMPSARLKRSRNASAGIAPKLSDSLRLPSELVKPPKLGPLAGVGALIPERCASIARIACSAALRPSSSLS